MTSSSSKQASMLDTDLELVVFVIDEVTCSLRIDEIQEIKKVVQITKVHRSPEYVRGVINLRGQIVTVIDLRVKFNYEMSDISSNSRIVIVNRDKELIGLLVDNIEDAVTAKSRDILPPPSNLRGVDARYFIGVFTMPQSLVAVLDLKQILEIENSEEVH